MQKTIKLEDIYRLSEKIGSHSKKCEKAKFYSVLDKMDVKAYIVGQNKGEPVPQDFAALNLKSIYWNSTYGEGHLHGVGLKWLNDVERETEYGTHMKSAKMKGHTMKKGVGSDEYLLNVF